MTATILDGKALAQRIKQDLKKRITQRLQNNLRPPGLAVILVGHDPASEIYVQNKQKACNEIGMISQLHHLPSTTTAKDLDNLIKQLNQDSSVDGILMQLPLPEGIDPAPLIQLIDPHKDVDGFHPVNVGLLSQRTPALRPCTPYGIVQLLRQYSIELKGKHAVIIGSSNIVGKPLALEFSLAKATVTLCNSATQHLEQLVGLADIVVAATGKCDLVHPDWLQNHQVLVDVGIHRMADGKIRGDVDFLKASERVAWITPVPGGVGPMTIATLLQNTLLACEHE